MGQLPADLFVGCCLMFEKLVKVKLLSTPGQRATLMKGLFIILMGYTNLLTSLSATALVGPSQKKKKKPTHTHTPTATMNIHTSAQVKKIYSKKTEQWCLEAALKRSGGSGLHLVCAGFRVAGPSGTESKCPAVH